MAGHKKLALRPTNPTTAFLAYSLILFMTLRRTGRNFLMYKTIRSEDIPGVEKMDDPDLSMTTVRFLRFVQEREGGKPIPHK